MKDTYGVPTWSGFAFLTGLLFGCVGAAAGQDVLLQGRSNGIAPPAWVSERLQQDPGAFEFRRAWMGKVRRIRATRGRAGVSAAPSYTSSSLAALGAAVVGTYSVPVIAGLYSGASAPYPQAEYQTRLFGDGAGSVSLSEYYGEISGGVFTMTGLVSDWATLPNPASYYEPVGSDQFGKTDEFLRDALLAADGATDFGLYDNDGLDGVPNSGDDDGFVDTAAFIYAAEAKSCGGPGIWPHRWTYDAWWSAPFTTGDAAFGGGFIQVSDYIIQSGLACFGAGIMASGTIAHEMGHALGLPDLYDTDLGDGTDSEGIGHWGLMGSGNHNQQESPAHMGAWSKDFLGWVDVTTIVANQTAVQLQAVQTARTVLRVDVPSTNEYFLLSNRQRTGSDAFLHEPGLLVWHIDPDVISATQPTNRVNADAAHKGVDIEEADGAGDLDNKLNRGDQGDVFPGFAGNTTFNLGSNPNSRAYAGAGSGLALANITHFGGLVTFDIFIDSFTEFVWGDVTNDDIVDLNDLLQIYAFSLGSTGGPTTIGRGDVDGDGDVDVMDGFVTHSFIDGVGTSGFRVGDLGVGEAPVVSAPPLPVTPAPVLISLAP
jgi:M6 family metalloprotease-like protein